MVVGAGQGFQGLPSVGGTWHELTNVPYDADDPDYRDYFSNVHQGEIGFYFYDGNHDYEDQLEGLAVAERFLAPGAVILVDDTNWDAPRQATLDFVSERRRLFNVVADISTVANGHPTFWNGLMLLQRNFAG